MYFEFEVHNYNRFTVLTCKPYTTDNMTMAMMGNPAFPLATMMIRYSN